MGAIFGRLGHWLYQQAYLLVCLTYLTWALNIVLGRHAAGHIPPITLSVWRWGLAGAILLPFALPHLKRDWPTIRAHAPIMAILALTGTTGYAVLSYGGLQYTQAINGLLIQCSMPLVVGFVSYILVSERLTPRQIVGGIVSLAGVAVILMRGDLDVLHAFSFNRGDLWFVGATFTFAVYSALMKKRPAMHPLSFLAATTILGTLLMLPFYIWEAASVGVPAMDARTISISLYVAIFPSLLAYICFNRGVQLIGPNQAAALYPLIIVFGAAIAITFLGERPELFHAVGTVLIVCGVWLATRTGRAGATSAAAPPPRSG